MSNFSANIQAVIKADDIQSQLDVIGSKSQLNITNIKVSSELLTKSIQSALNSTNFKINIGSVNDISKKMKEANKSISAESKASSRLAESAAKAEEKAWEIKAKARAKAADAEEKARAKAEAQAAKKAESEAKAAAKAEERAAETRARANAKKAESQQTIFDKAKKSFDSNDIEKSIRSIEGKFEDLKDRALNIGVGEKSNLLHDQLKTVKEDFDKLNSLQNKMKATKDSSPKEFVQAWNEYNDVLKRTNNNLDIATTSAKQFSSTMDVAKLQNRLDSWLNENPKAASTYGESIKNLSNELKNLSSQGSVFKKDAERISDAFKEIDASAQSAGLKGKTFLSSFSGAFKSLSKYISASTLIYTSLQTLKNGVKDVIDLDTALIDLKKTTTASDAQLKEFYFSSNDTAKQLGVSTKSVIQAAADWSRLGYSIKDAEEMAKVSSILTSISPGMDISKSTDGLVSIMKAFDIQAEDALDGIASKINAIGNTQALNNSDIVEFMTRSASAMKEANNSLEETIALGTAATEITRDAAGVGQVLKTVSMRLRGKLITASTHSNVCAVYA